MEVGGKYCPLLLALGALHNAIMEVGGKYCPLMLAPGNYVQVPPATPGNDGTPQQPREEIILIGIDNDIYSKVDACPNAMEIWKAIKGKEIANSPPPTYDSKPKVVNDDEAASKEKEIDKLMDLISMYSSSAVDWDSMSQLQRIWACSKGMDDTDDEPEDQELEAHYMYMAKIQEVIPNVADNSGPIFDTEQFEKVHNNDDNYNVFANERQHLEQPESVNGTYLVEQVDTNTTANSLYMSNNGGEANQDEQMF
nr:hypothetical protein [Tanacetum cinerariifolium]